MSRFFTDLKAFADKTKVNMNAIVYKTVLDIGTRIVMRSPVGDGNAWKHKPPKGYVGGRFRGNWQYGDGAIPNGIVRTIDASGQLSIGRITAGLKPDAAGRVHYLVNKLPYAMPLETGWSKQAPAGMVDVTVREFESIVKRAVDEVKK